MLRCFAIAAPQHSYELEASSFGRAQDTDGPVVLARLANGDPLPHVRNPTLESSIDHLESQSCHLRCGGSCRLDALLRREYEL